MERGDPMRARQERVGATCVVLRVEADGTEGGDAYRLASKFRRIGGV